MRLKKISAFLLSLILIISLIPSAFAEELTPIATTYDTEKTVTCYVGYENISIYYYPDTIDDSFEYTIDETSLPEGMDTSILESSPDYVNLIGTFTTDDIGGPYYLGVYANSNTTPSESTPILKINISVQERPVIISTPTTTVIGTSEDAQIIGTVSDNTVSVSDTQNIPIIEEASTETSSPWINTPAGNVLIAETNTVEYVKDPTTGQNTLNTEFSHEPNSTVSFEIINTGLYDETPAINGQIIDMAGLSSNNTSGNDENEITVSDSINNLEIKGSALEDVKNIDENSNVLLGVSNGESSLILDSGAANEVLDNADKSVELCIKTGTNAVDTMNEAQVATYNSISEINGTAVAVDIKTLADGNEVSNYNGGYAYMTIPYSTLLNGLTGENAGAILNAVRLNENGTTTKITCGKISCPDNSNAAFGRTEMNSHYIFYLSPFTYDDVASDSYYTSAVYYGQKNGIFKGTDSTHFSPDNSVTRAQLVTMLWNAAGKPNTTVENLPFTDINADSYYAKAVAWAYENSISLGTDENHFSPDMSVTRAQAVTFLYRYHGIDTQEIKDNPFADVNEGDYFYDAALWAYTNGITLGTTETLFSPDIICSRAQAACFIYRLSNLG